METEKTVENIFSMLEEINQFVEKKVKRKEIEDNAKPTEKKNTQIHLFIETSLDQKLIREAEEKGISKSELIRQRLRDNTQLNRIESKLNLILEKSINP